jgi:hypothetical protein
MTDITIADLENLAASLAAGNRSAQTATQDVISIGGLGLPGAAETVVDPNVAGKTLTFESRDWTVVLDFDKVEFLTRLTFL